MDKDESQIEIVCKNEGKPTPHALVGPLINPKDLPFLSPEIIREFEGAKLYTCLSCKSTLTYLPGELPK